MEEKLHLAVVSEDPVHGQLVPRQEHRGGKGVAEQGGLVHGGQKGEQGTVTESKE